MNSGSRTTPPAHLRRIDNPIEVPAEQRACPKCGNPRGCTEPHVTEVIDVLPPEVIVRRDIREQLRCEPCEGAPVRAPAGETVVPNGKLGLGLVASILIDKYVDGLPLHRQRERFRRLGIELAVSTLADQVHVRAAPDSCRLAGVDPHAYLADVLPRLTGRIRIKDLPDLLPSRWAAARAAAAASPVSTPA